MSKLLEANRLLTDRPHFTMRDIHVLCGAVERAGGDVDKIRFDWGPRRNLSGNPHQLTALVKSK